MGTERLFDRDVNTLTFRAKVLRCEPDGDAWAAELDRTAFFPEGGGQMPDRGTLNGIAVLDVHEKEGCILHRIAAPIAAGEEAEGIVDAAHRFDMMQQHSGEHIFSGIAHRLYGCENVGFHIGDPDVTVDLNKPLTAEEVRRVERLANEIIWQNIPVHAWFPSAAELETIEYRSKKALTGAVRIVEIAGADTCACCGTHVEKTGAIGQIKVVSCQNYKGGVRLMLRCGRRALEAANETLDENRAVSRALSAKPGTLEASVQRLLAERDELKTKLAEAAADLFRIRADSLRGESIRVMVSAMPAAQLRKAAGTLAEGAKYALIALKKDDGTYAFSLSSPTEDVRPAAKALADAFGGRGGGPKDMVQGILLSGSEPEWKKLLSSL